MYEWILYISFDLMKNKIKKTTENFVKRNFVVLDY